MSKRYFEVVVFGRATARNVKNSSCDKASKGWLTKWSKETGESKNCVCSFRNCNNPAELGGHLWIEGESLEYYYIAPICKKCNNDPERDREYFRMKLNTTYLKTSVNVCTKNGFKDDNEKKYEGNQKKNVGDKKKIDNSLPEYLLVIIVLIFYLLVRLIFF